MEYGLKDIFLLSVFVSFIIVANIMSGIKLVNLWGMIVPAGFIAYSLTFPITDIIDEVRGKKMAQQFVWAGFIANIFALLLIWVGYLLPPLTNNMQSIYGKALIPFGRIVLASMVAYLISQNHDVWAFMKWREITSGKHLWIRNNLSTMASQAIDTFIFITIAFYGVVPTMVLLNMIVVQYLWKLIIALCDTPLVYLGVKLYKGWRSPVEGVESEKI